MNSEEGCFREFSCEGQLRFGMKNRECREEKHVSVPLSQSRPPSLSLGHGTQLLTEFLPASTLGFF